MNYHRPVVSVRRASLCWLLVSIALVACRATERQQPPPRQEGVLRVVCFGDSITGHHPASRLTYQRRYLKYPDLLQLMLEARLGLDRAEVINSGWAGDRTTPRPVHRWPGAVGRLDADLLDLEPDIAVVLIGGNDAARTEAERVETRSNLETIFTRTRKAGIRVLALQYPPALPDPDNEDEGWHHLPKLANPLIAAAAEASGVELCDLGPPVVAAAETHGRAAVADPKDGVHLHPRGEIAYARAIFAELLRQGWVAEP